MLTKLSYKNIKTALNYFSTMLFIATISVIAVVYVNLSPNFDFNIYLSILILLISSYIILISYAAFIVLRQKIHTFGDSLNTNEEKNPTQDYFSDMHKKFTSYNNKALWYVVFAAGIVMLNLQSWVIVAYALTGLSITTVLYAFSDYYYLLFVESAPLNKSDKDDKKGLE